MRAEGRLAPLLAWLWVAWLGAPASGEVTPVEAWPNLRTSASLRARGEFHNFFDPGGTANNDYAFGGTVLRGAVAWKSEPFDLVVEGQNSALFGLPDDAILPAPQGQLGLGATYFANNRAQNDASVFLKQGYLNLKELGLKGLSVKGGRFEFSEGSEILTGEPTLDWLKNLRLSQRLIGPFSFSHVGRSLDGVTASWTSAPFNGTVLAAHPTQGGFDLAANKEISDIDLGYVAFNVTRPELAKNSDARFFYIYYSDGRGLLKTDNRPEDVRTLDRRHIEIHSEGGHYIQVFPSGAGPFDVLAWGVTQQGRWGELDHQAWAWDFETGWQPAALPWKPWLRIGYGRTSGDDDPSDGDHGTFFQILPTGRVYSYSTYYNLLNNEDAFAEILFRPIAGVLSRTAFHDVRLNASKDLWYQGSGATVADRDVGFGYSGRPASGHHELMYVAETSLNYDWSPSVSIGLYYGHLFGADVVRSIFQGDQADFGFLEVTLRL
jgi:hypothetical protein